MLKQKILQVTFFYIVHRTPLLQSFYHFLILKNNSNGIATTVVFLPKIDFSLSFGRVYIPLLLPEISSILRIQTTSILLRALFLLNQKTIVKPSQIQYTVHLYRTIQKDYEENILFEESTLDHSGLPPYQDLPA